MSTNVASGSQDASFVQLFRLWSAARANGRLVMPDIHTEAQAHGFADQTAAAAASLFCLLEGQVGRRLSPGKPGDREFTADERALIGLLRQAPMLQPGRGTRAIPHGLPGAISWAARCLCDAMGIEVDHGIYALQAAAANSQDCPFAITAERRGSAEG